MNISVEHLTTPLSTLIPKFYPIGARDLSILDYCQSLGEVWTGYIDDEFICCWGLIPPSFLSTQAYLWMWGPKKMKHQLVFIRQSQIQVRKMLERYDTIIGECLVEAKSSQRWLRWLGAEFYPQQNGMIPFTIRKAHG